MRRYRSTFLIYQQARGLSGVVVIVDIGEFDLVVVAIINPLGPICG